MANVQIKDVVSEFLERYKKDLIFVEEYNSFFIWRDGWYEELTKRQMKKMAFDFVEEIFPQQGITKNFFENFYEIANLRCPREIALGEPLGGYISFEDKLLDVNSFRVIDKDRKHICLHYLPYKWSDIGKPIPNFLHFLETSLVNKDNTSEPDQELIKLIQEMLGFFLMETMKGSAAFFFVGEGSNGKTTLIKVIEQMIGERFISAMSIQSLTTDKFASHNLIGKKINISNEEESKYMEDSVFKALVTGDRVAGQKKFGEIFQFIPKTKFIFATNELPTFRNLNHAIKRRIKIIPFYRIFKDDEQDKELTKKLKEEIVGIIGWAIEGGKRFVENDYMFSGSKAMDERMKEFENETSAAVRFVRENYDVDNENFISNDDLYEDYKDWCHRTGRSPKNQTNFSTDITRNIKEIESKTSSVNGITLRGKGIKKKPTPTSDFTIDEAIDMIKP